VAAFWTLGAILLAFLFAASAPSPLYVVYQARWGFSAATLTTVFAVYALALLIALVTVGALSDYVGRRPVLAAALLVEALSMVLFIAADGVGWLLAARAVQGLATGAATGAISAYLIDLQSVRNPRLGALVNSTAPSVGLATGALGSGLLVQFAPAPTALVFAVLVVAFAAALLGVALMPETARRRPGAVASLRPRVSVPRRIRPDFLVVTPCLVATWALGGLYLSLGPSLAAGVLHIQSHLIGGLVIFALAGMGVVGSLALRDGAPRRVMVVGSVVLSRGRGSDLARPGADVHGPVLPRHGDRGFRFRGGVSGGVPDVERVGGARRAGGVVRDRVRGQLPGVQPAGHRGRPGRLPARSAAHGHRLRRRGDPVRRVGGARAQRAAAA